ncbi:zinc carboxypeptidase [Folsomia candida]|uniref:zinc carboxypeptidase n=1 Tax=Folsomia candida TaxID=158441 RepID=UPI000B8F122C|nr:zinc carboxypeptidase [Folsomia candida]
MKFALVVTLTLLGLAFSNQISAERVKYDNYKVYRFIPQTEEERQVLIQLQESNLGVKFWKGVKSVGQPVDVMVPPHVQMDLLPAMTRRENMGVSVFVEDVQKLIDQEALTILKEGRALDWTSYGTLADIYEFLDAQAAAHSDIAEVISIGTSFEGRDLKVLSISKSGNTKPAIWYDATIHAREWISGATCTYIVNELLNSADPAIVQLTVDFDWKIMCVANPDGYVYTHTTDRMWRKTRSNTTSPLGCKGADPNRNWGYQFNTGGSSGLPCDDTYHGTTAFSQVETKAMSDYFNTIADRAVFFLSVHSYSQFILLPYGYSNTRYPDYNEYMRIGNAAKAAIARRYNTQFTVGNIVDLLYPASGGSVDWAKGIHDTSLVLAFELRDTGRYGFILPADQIIPSSLEFLDALLEMVAQLRDRIEAKQQPRSASAELLMPKKA